MKPPRWSNSEPYLNATSQMLPSGSRKLKPQPQPDSSGCSSRPRTSSNSRTRSCARGTARGSSQAIATVTPRNPSATRPNRSKTVWESHEAVSLRRARRRTCSALAELMFRSRRARRAESGNLRALSTTIVNGGGGIRTHEPGQGPAVFKTATKKAICRSFVRCAPVGAPARLVAHRVVQARGIGVAPIGRTTDGAGGQGIKPLPNVYDGWVQDTVARTAQTTRKSKAGSHS
jgi:hypothetical protein